MTRDTPPTPRRKVITTSLLAATAVAGLISIGVTSASFTDDAAANLGGDAGLGGKFDIAMVDADGSTLIDAPTPDTAATLTFTPDNTAFTKKVPLHLTAAVTNRAESAAGDILVQLVDPDPAASDLFAQLRFTVDVDGSTVAVGASADQFNALQKQISAAQPGETHTVSVSVVLDKNTPHAYHGTASAVGITFQGVSRP
jgi:hypothetical protein